MPDETTTSRVTGGSLRLAVLLTLAGGFLDAFTFVGHGGVFANAQTGNVVLLGVEAAAGRWSAAVRHVPALLAYVAGVATAETMMNPASPGCSADPQGPRWSRRSPRSWVSERSPRRSGAARWCCSWRTWPPCRAPRS